MRYLIVLLLFAVNLSAFNPIFLTGPGRNRSSGGAILTITEPFGIAHAEQLVELDVGVSEPFYIYDGTNYYPHQQTSTGTTLVLFENGMTADQVITLQFIPGSTELDDYADPIQRTDETSLATHLLENANIAIRIPKEVATPTVFLAPLQSFRYPDATWEMTGDLVILEKPNEAAYTTIGTIDDMTVTFLEEGPLRYVVQVDYDVQKVAYNYGGGQFIDPAGDAIYNTTITMFAHDDVVMFEIDTDFDSRWQFDIDTGLTPDRAQYRPYSTSHVDQGYHPVSGLVINGNDEEYTDAYVDQPFPTPLAFAGLRNMFNWSAGGLFDIGSYWQFYDTAGAAGSNMFGMFHGPTSRIVGGHYSGLEPNSDAAAVTNIKVGVDRRGPDLKWSVRNRFGFGIFLGVKSDVLSPELYQTIAKKQIIHTGLNLTKVLSLGLDINDPDVGHAFLSEAAFESWVDAVQISADSFSGVYGEAYDNAPSYTSLWDAVYDPATYASAAVAEVTATITSDFTEYYLESGIYSIGRHYWKGTRSTRDDFFKVTTLLALDDYQSSSLTDAERTSLQASTMLLYNLYSDNDFAPMQDLVTIGLGTANMPVQYKAGRDSWGVMQASLDGTPTVDTATILTDLEASINSSINAFGVHESSPHYQGEASFQPLLYLMMQLDRAGLLTSINSRVDLYADYLIAELTPTEPRFGAGRKLVAIGDGSTEKTSMPGTLATLYKSRDVTLSQELMKAWRDANSAHEEVTGPTVVMIDSTISSGTLTTTDKYWNGFGTILRNNLGNDDETVLHFIHGEVYNDHRHTDMGSFSLYANGAPVSIDWGSIFNPRTDGRGFHNTIVPEASLGFTWTTNSWGLSDEIFGDENGADTVEGSSQNFTDPATVDADIDIGGNDWNRQIKRYLDVEADSTPFRITDTFTGAWATDSKILTLALMASGIVTTPDGDNTPSAGVTGVSASAATAYSFTSGIHRFDLIGQWEANVTIFVIAADSGFYAISEYDHDWHPSTEESEWVAVNGGSFEETQYIFRIKSSGIFDVIIVPYDKDNIPSVLGLTEDGGGSPDGTYTLDYDGTNIDLDG